jgi:peptidyl-tRNA hydrolase, PTH2 family
MEPLTVGEAVAGGALLFFVPGFAVAKAVFPERRHTDPDGLLWLVELAALGFVLSVVLTVVVGYLLLVGSPGGFRADWSDPLLEACLAALALVAFVVGLFEGVSGSASSGSWRAPPRRQVSSGRGCGPSSTRPGSRRTRSGAVGRRSTSSRRSASRGQDHKLVVVVRGELRLTAGKAAVQVAHAAVLLARRAERQDPREFETWWAGGQRKVALQVRTLDELEALERKARAASIPTVWVEDAGFTEVPPGTRTCLGLGPAPDSVLDPVTGSLDLL